MELLGLCPGMMNSYTGSDGEDLICTLTDQPWPRVGHTGTGSRCVIAGVAGCRKPSPGLQRTDIKLEAPVPWVSHDLSALNYTLTITIRRCV